MVDDSRLILVVTNKVDLTADMVILAFQKQGIPYARFNTEDFPQRVRLSWRPSTLPLDGYIDLPKARVILSNIKSVWFRRPLPPVVSGAIMDIGERTFAQREAQEALAGLWRTMTCFWMSHPDAINYASYKPRQLKMAQELGLIVPHSLISNSPSEVELFRKQHGPLIAKPIHSGLVEAEDGSRVIYTNPVGNEDLSSETDIELAPCLFQEHIQKEVELRVTIIGGSIFAAKINSQEFDDAKNDWRRAHPGTLTFRSTRLPLDIARRCQQLTYRLDLTFAAIDMIRTPEGKYVFLELNPNGQWGWLERATGDSYVDAIVHTLNDGGVERA